MKILYDFEDRMFDELEDICKEGKLTENDIAMAYKIVDIIKDIETIDAMKQYDSGYSGTGYSYANANMRGYSETWPSMPPMYAREGQGNSNARGRDSMGRYTSRDSSYAGGYTGHDSKEGLIEELNRMMMNAHNDEERERYRRALEQLNR